MPCRHSSFAIRVVTAVVIATFTGVAVVPAPCLAQSTADSKDEVIARRFEDVMVLKSQGEFERAVTELTAMIAEYRDTEQVSRLAYSYLVATYHEQKDTEGARRAAAEALERYPDISARDIITVPPSVDEYYDTLRREMFGALHIVEPKGALVFLDQNPVGEAETPIRLGLVRVGEHELMLTKSGYHDYVEPITIRPGENLEKTIQMKRARGKKWWVVRVGAVVVAGVIVYTLWLKDGQKELGKPPPLPD